MAMKKKKRKGQSWKEIKERREKRMSDKKQQDQAPPGMPSQPKKIGQVLIDVYENMDVNVSQFPTDHHMSMMVLGNALLAVNNWFAQQAQNKKSNIILAKPGASAMDIKKMRRDN